MFAPAKQRFISCIFSGIFVANIIACSPTLLTGRSKAAQGGSTKSDDVSEQLITAAEGGTAALGSFVVTYEPESSANDFKVRLTRKQAPPALSEAEQTVLGNPEGEVFQVELFDPKSNLILSSEQLLKPYQAEQIISSSKSKGSLGVMVATEVSSPKEKHTLLPNQELTVTEVTDKTSEPSGSELALAAAALNFSVRYQTKITSGTVWVVSYSAGARDVLDFGDKDSISTSGGTPLNNVSEPAPTNESNVSISINSGAGFTTSTSVTIDIEFDNSAEMYITSQSDCSSGGYWETVQSTKSWTLVTPNAMNRVYGMFRTSDGKTSECINDSIFVDNVSPNPPTNFSDGQSFASLETTPTFSWTEAGDTGSGVDYYEISLGTTSGATNLKNWTKVTGNTSGSLSGLSLSGGKVFANLRAVDFAGLTSSVVSSDGWIAYSSASAHVMFVTSTAYDGNLGGLSGADAKCTASALAGSQTAALSGVWRAVLSSSITDAKDRITLASSSPIKSPQGDLIAANPNELKNSELVSAPKYDENGNIPGASSGVTVFTNTNPGWVKAASDAFNAACSEWLFSSVQPAAIGGTSNSVNSAWMNRGNTLSLSCRTIDPSHLYCINSLN